MTNRYSSHKDLFRSIQLGESNKQSIIFTSWPYIHEFNKGQFMSQKFTQAQTDLQKDLFEYTEVGDYETHLIYDTLPSIIKRIDLRNKDKAMIQLKPLYAASLEIHE